MREPPVKKESSRSQAGLYSPVITQRGNALATTCFHGVGYLNINSEGIVLAAWMIVKDNHRQWKESSSTQAGVYSACDNTVGEGVGSCIICYYYRVYIVVVIHAYMLACENHRFQPSSRSQAGLYSPVITQRGNALATTCFHGVGYLNINSEGIVLAAWMIVKDNHRQWKESSSTQAGVYSACDNTVGEGVGSCIICYYYRVYIVVVIHAYMLACENHRFQPLSRSQAGLYSPVIIQRGNA